MVKNGLNWMGRRKEITERRKEGQKGTKEDKKGPKGTRIQEGIARKKCTRVKERRRTNKEEEKRLKVIVDIFKSKRKT
jgi:hypothetical protein